MEAMNDRAPLFIAVILLIVIMLSLLLWASAFRAPQMAAINGIVSLSTVILAVTAGAAFVFRKSNSLIPLLSPRLAVRIRAMGLAVLSLSWVAVGASIRFPSKAYRDYIAGVAYDPHDALRAQINATAIIVLIIGFVTIYNLNEALRRNKRL